MRGICQTYVELFANVPVLIQLLMWYLLFTELLPEISEARNIGPFFLATGRDVVPNPGVVDLALGYDGWRCDWTGRGWLFRRRTVKRFEETGQMGSMFLVPLVVVIAGALAGWVAGGMPTTWVVPKKGEFAVEGGAR